MSESTKKWFLVASNLSYLMPAGVCCYKMALRRSRRMDAYDGAQLIILFLFVAFFSSWSYHACRADLSSNEDNFNVDIEPCTNCPSLDSSMAWMKLIPGSSMPLNFQVSRLVDHFLATFTLIMVILTVLPLHDKLRKLIMIIALVWIILFLTTGNEVVSLIPAMIALILLIFFWWTVRNQKDGGMFSRNTSWLLAFACLVVAGTCFIITPEPYWIMHSLWHIFSALAASFLLFRLATCYQDVDLEKIQFPQWMSRLFTSPGSCEIYDPMYSACASV